MPEEPQTEITPVPAPRNQGRMRRSDADKVRAAQFTIVMRGYDRAAVDAWREEIAQLVERLEEAQPRDAAVKRA
ncbi:MAG: DivIVA domain-containing protein, partial [Thermoleophilaceae bacterium]|nr:DivIVA domain-containing protein [Thermoleophilaceae bacterium]